MEGKLREAMVSLRVDTFVPIVRAPRPTPSRENGQVPSQLAA